MNQYIKNKIIIFYSSILLMLPVLNGLHFILINHNLSQTETNKKITSHKCDDFTLFQIYTIDNPEFEISNPIEIKNFFELNYRYQNDYILHINVRINNKGPPFLA